MNTPTNKIQLLYYEEKHTVLQALDEKNQLVAKILTHIIYNKGMKLY